MKDDALDRLGLAGGPGGAGLGRGCHRGRGWRITVGLGGRPRGIAAFPHRHDAVGNLLNRTHVDKVFQLDGDAKVTFGGVHDDRQAAGADGQILADVHVGLDFVPLVAGGVHDDPDHGLNIVPGGNRRQDLGNPGCRLG